MSAEQGYREGFEAGYATGAVEPRPFDPRSPDAREYFRRRSHEKLVELGLTTAQADAFLADAEAWGRSLADRDNNVLTNPDGN